MMNSPQILLLLLLVDYYFDQQKQNVEHRRKISETNVLAIFRFRMTQYVILTSLLQSVFFFKILTSNHYWSIECCDDFGSIFSRVLNSKIPPALHNSRSSSENEKDSSHIVVLSQKIICLLSPLISVDIRENSFLKQLFLKSRIVMDPGTKEIFGAL